MIDWGEYAMINQTFKEQEEQEIEKHDALKKAELKLNMAKEKVAKKATKKAKEELKLAQAEYDWVCEEYKSKQRKGWIIFVVCLLALGIPTIISLIIILSIH